MNIPKQTFARLVRTHLHDISPGQEIQLKDGTLDMIQQIVERHILDMLQKTQSFATDLKLATVTPILIDGILKSQFGFRYPDSAFLSSDPPSHASSSTEDGKFVP